MAQHIVAIDGAVGRAPDVVVVIERGMVASPFHVAVVRGETFRKSFNCVPSGKLFTDGSSELLTTTIAFSHVSNKANFPDDPHLASGNT